MMKLFRVITMNDKNTKEIAWYAAKDIDVLHASLNSSKSSTVTILSIEDRGYVNVISEG